MNAAASTRPQSHKWMVLSNTTLGMLAAAINGSILLISLPAVFRGIGLKALDPGNINYLLWAIIGYMIATAVLVVAFGRLGDQFGRVLEVGRLQGARAVVEGLRAVLGQDGDAGHGRYREDDDASRGRDAHCSATSSGIRMTKNTSV